MKAVRITPSDFKRLGLVWGIPATEYYIDFKRFPNASKQEENTIILSICQHIVSSHFTARSVPSETIRLEATRQYGLQGDFSASIKGNVYTIEEFLFFPDNSQPSY